MGCIHSKAYAEGTVNIREGHLFENVDAIDTGSFDMGVRDAGASIHFNYPLDSLDQIPETGKGQQPVESNSRNQKTYEPEYHQRNENDQLESKDTVGDELEIGWRRKALRSRLSRLDILSAEIPATGIPLYATPKFGNYNCGMIQGTSDEEGVVISEDLVATFQDYIKQLLNEDGNASNHKD